MSVLVDDVVARRGSASHIRTAYTGATLSLILLLGAVVIAPHLGDQSLWVDESLTVGPALSARGVGELIDKVVELDTQPPGSHLVLYALRSVLPATEFGVRLPSFVAIQIGLVFLFLLVARMWNARVAVALVGAAQASPFLAFYGAEARNYGLWFLLIAASLLCCARAVEQLNRGDVVAARRWNIVCGVANALGLWVHVFHVFVVAGELACVAAALRTRRAPATAMRRFIWSLAVGQILAVALFLPWLVVLWSHARTGVGWTREFGIRNLGYYLFAALFGSSLGPNSIELHREPFAQVLAVHPWTLTLAGLAIAGFVGLYARRVSDAVRRSTRRWELIPLVLYPCVALVGPLVYAFAAEFPLNVRHLLFAWPLLPLVLALSWYRERGGKVIVAGILALQLSALTNFLADPYYAKDDCRSAVEFAEAHSGPVTYILGDGLVAPFYSWTAIGVPKHFTELPRDTDDVWFMDSLVAAEINAGYLQRLEPTLARLGLRPTASTDQFHGLVLRHWTTDRRAEVSHVAAGSPK